MFIIFKLEKVLRYKSFLFKGLNATNERNIKLRRTSGLITVNMKLVKNEIGRDVMKNNRNREDEEWR